MPVIVNKIIIILVSFIFLQVAPLYAEASYTFKVKNTEFIGSVEKEKGGKKTISFVGIPFAEPPVGNLRWKAPREIDKYPDTFEATTLPNRCMQISNFYDEMDGIEGGSIIGSEDCLYLNIYLSEKAYNSKEKLPVVFWIHGGGNTWGYSASNIFTSGDFILEHDVILVTTNYRLGPFGWFAYSGLNQDSDNSLDNTANFGTLDIIKSLEWVNEHISHFNGDPDNITIFGESAGARNVISLMSSHLSKDLFQRGISQSGYLGSDSLEYSENNDRAGSLSLLKHLIKSKNPNILDEELSNFMSNKMMSTEFLRSASAKDIISYYRVRNDSGGLIDVPNVIPDGVVIPMKGIYGVYRDGEMHDKPMIFGSTRDEDKLFMFANDEFVDRPLAFLRPISEYFDLYVKPKDPKFYDIYARYMAESWKYGAVDLPSDFTSQNKESDVYAYRFDWDEQNRDLGLDQIIGINIPGINLNLDLPRLLGAGHAMELAFVFKSGGLLGESFDAINDVMYDENNRDTDLDLATKMGKYWVNFAYDGNPNSFPYNVDTEWMPWDANNQNERFMVFDTVNDKGIKMFNNTLSEDSILQGIASENITVNQKCYIIDKMFNRTTLTNEEVDEIYRTFMSGKCARA